MREENQLVSDVALHANATSRASEGNKERNERLKNVRLRKDAL